MIKNTHNCVKFGREANDSGILPMNSLFRRSLTYVLNSITNVDKHFLSKLNSHNKQLNNNIYAF